MRGLSAQGLLHVWEAALQQHSVDRALTILAIALPEIPWDELLILSVGQRDTQLLAVRERTFGSQLAGFAECPVCQEQLEFMFDVADIRAVSQTQGKTQGALYQTSKHEGYEVTIEEYNLRFRLPHSLDLAEIARCGDVLAARNLLIQRCVLQASRDGTEVVLAALPERVITMLVESIGQYDPQAEVQLSLNCSMCGENWSVVFDIVSFFWSEICVQAKRLLREVHTLARTYGWREADILSMSTARRQFYLEMVT